MSRIDQYVNGLNPNAKVEHRPRLAPEQDFDCPMCDGKLKRKYSRQYDRYFYGCRNWVKTKCNGSIGCHPDGSPLGIPTSQEGKDWRKKAHASFDTLWKEGELTRQEAYWWMREHSGVGVGHIGEMSQVQCKELIDAVDNFDFEGFLEAAESRRASLDRDCFIYDYQKD